MVSEIAIPYMVWTLNNDYDKILINIGRNVKRLRKEKGLSQINLAIEADVDKTYIGYLENAKHNVSVKVLCQLAKSLDVGVEELISEEIHAIR